MIIKQNKLKVLYLILPIITFILELLPYGAVCNFARPDGDLWRKTYSYFSLTPFGYANFAPLLTALTTCAVIILLLIGLFYEKPRMISAAKAFLCIGTVLSLCPLFYGIAFFSLVGAFISASLIAELVLLLVKSKINKK